jgi:HlyD family secretion protein
MVSAKKQHRNILLAVNIFIVVVALVVIIGFVLSPDEPEPIQGEVEVTEYRVSGKVPGRIVELRVQEGDHVEVGDTLAIIDAPELRAKLEQAQGAEGAAAALEQKARNGAREEQIRGAYEQWQQAKAGREIAEKSYQRVEHLFQEGVMSEQKRDEARANYKAAEAREKAAQSQYDMAVNGAREEERRAAAAQTERARGAVSEVNSYLGETVQMAQMAGEVSSVYPKVGELVGTGSPIMTIAVLDDVWATFNVREDCLAHLRMGDEFTAYIPTFDRDIRMKVFYIQPQGSYAVWKATKANGGYDLRTFEVKARPVEATDGLRPGMSIIIK